MKKFPKFLLLTSALLLPALLSAKSFEGKITMTMSAPKHDPQPMNFSVKEGRQRIDIEAKEKNGKPTTVSSIMDFNKQEMITLIPQEKMYMVMSLNLQKSGADAQQAQGDVTLEKTGETEKILGYTCTKYIVKSKNGESCHLWATDELGTYMGMGGGGGNPMGRRGNANQTQAWEKAIMGRDFFPMRVVGFDKSGKESFRMETTAVQKQSLPDSLFAPPADYSEFKMPSMGDMMKGMIPGR